LQFRVSSVFLIQQKSGVVGFFFKSLQGDQITVMSCLEVVVLKQFFILKVSVFGLNGVKLVS